VSVPIPLSDHPTSDHAKSKTKEIQLKKTVDGGDYKSPMTTQTQISDLKKKMTNRSTSSILLAAVCIPLALNLYVGLVNSPIQKQQQKRSDNEYLLRAWNESDVSVSTQYPEWLNLSKCFQANTDIVVGSEFGRRFHRGKRRVSPDEIRKLSIPTRLLNVGMPKIGTSSLQALFMNSGERY